MKQELQMVTVEMTTAKTSFVSSNAAETAWAPTQSYHELADIPVREIDLLEAVEANVAQLEQLQARLNFMVREVKYLLKA